MAEGVDRIVEIVRGLPEWLTFGIAVEVGEVEVSYLYPHCYYGSVGFEAFVFNF